MWCIRARENSPGNAGEDVVRDSEKCKAASPFAKHGWRCPHFELSFKREEWLILAGLFDVDRALLNLIKRGDDFGIGFVSALVLNHCGKFRRHIDIGLFQ